MQINGKEIFEKGGLMFYLSLMASFEYQDKYIIHPTIDEYERIRRKWQKYYVTNASEL